MARDETTTKFKVDISELKREFQEAQRVIRVANSEFKAASAGMDDWSTSADGLQAKINQLTTVLSAEKTKLESLEKQYRLVAEEQGENSRGAQEMMIRINNQRAAIANIERSLEGWQNSLAELNDESTNIVKTINNQEAELAQLKEKYAKLIIEQGKESDAARELENAIERVSTELAQNRSTLAQARSEADRFDNTLEDVGDAAEDAGDGFTVMKGALAELIADGIQKAVSLLSDMAKELINVESAYDGFQAKTGASAEEMKAFKEEMNDLYKNAYGESLEDIGDKMAYVKQVTGEVDPSKIKELTENAIALEDTFGSDFNETVRGVSNLMKHFGLDSATAFDLFAKGSQKGLDYTSELGDNIAEYGGNFAQAGYSAEEYFQLLVNGSQGGAYNLDKVNDSINEVKNRLGDGTIEKNIDQFSDGTKKTFKEWKSGKKTMKNVIDSIVKDINDCTNEQDALTMAATAFGTMGEDANLAVVKSLTTVGEEFDNVAGSMESIKEIKYDNVQTQLTMLGRKFQTEIMLPIVEKALPLLENGIKWISENLDTLIPIVTTLGAAFVAMFVVNKIATFVSSIKTMITTVKSLTTATQAQSAAQTALNATNPFGWVALAITAVTTLVGVLVSLNNGSTDTKNKFAELSAEEQALRDKTNELTQAYDEFAESKNNAISNVNNEFAYYQTLADELNTLVDANGKVKKGYEDRAAVIAGILSEALGTEIEITDGVIQKYNELKTSIENVIATKKAEAILSATEAEYTTAIQNRTQAMQTYMENQKQMTALTNDYIAANTELTRIKEMGLATWAEEQGLSKNSEQTMWLYAQAVEEAQNKVNGLADKHQKQRGALTKAEEAMIGYNQTIENYEGVSAAIIGGDIDEINLSLSKLENGFISAEQGTREALAEQNKTYEKQLENLKQAIKDKMPGVTQEQVDQMERLVELSEEELEKLPPEAEEQGEKTAEKFSEGVENKRGNAKTAGENLASEAEDGLKTTDSEATGEDFAQGFIEGMGSKSSGIWSQAWNMGVAAIEAVKKATATASPSKKAIEVGEFFSEGLQIGIENGETDVVNAVAEIADKMVEEASRSEVFDALIDTAKSTQDERLKAIEKSLDAEETAYRKTQKAETKALEKSLKEQMEALKSKQKEESELLEEALDNELNDYKTAHNEKLKMIDEEYTEKLKLVDEKRYNATKEIDDAINAINAKTDAEEKAEKERNNQEKIAALRQNILTAKTIAERQEAEQEFAEYAQEINRERILEERAAQIKNLEARKAEINEKYDLEAEKLNSELKAKKEAQESEYAAEVEKIKQAYAVKEELLDKQHEAAIEKLQEEQEARKEALGEQQQIALEDLRERHSVYLSNVKDELKAELEALKLKKTETLKMLDELSEQKEKENAVKEAQMSGAVTWRNREYANQAKKAGGDTANGFASGINSEMNNVRKSVNGLGANVISLLNHSLDINSPSKKTAEIGEFFARGLQVGIEDGENSLLKSIQNLADDITNALQDNLNFDTNLLAPINDDIRKINKKDFGAANQSAKVENVTNVTNFYQTNNSPKALSRIDIYRQTKNQLTFREGV